MLFFGWGRRNLTWTLDSGKHLVASWSYFHFFFFPLAFKTTWHLIGDSRAEDSIIDYNEVKKLVPINTPTIGFWNRFGLLIGIGVLCLIGIVNG
jgi:hypothetical protein